jgi:hypothetical protein
VGKNRKYAFRFMAYFTRIIQKENSITKMLFGMDYQMDENSAMSSIAEVYREFFKF